MGINWIGKFGTKEIRARACVANISEKNITGYILHQTYLHCSQDNAGYILHQTYLHCSQDNAGYILHQTYLHCSQDIKRWLYIAPDILTLFSG